MILRVLVRRQVCTLPPRVREAVEKVKACVKESNAIYGCPFKKVDEIMSGAGATFLGRGVNRYGYGYDGCVVKLAKSEAQRGDNMKETDTFRSMPPTIRPLFAQVGESDPDGYWETMERVEVEDVPEDERVFLAREVKQKLRDLGYYCGDLHAGNVGMLRGRGVITNYGYEVGECPVPVSRK